MSSPVNNMTKVFNGHPANTKEGYGYPLIYESDSSEKKVLFRLEHKEPSGRLSTPHYTVKFENGLRLNQMEGLSAVFDNYMVMRRRYRSPEEAYSYYDQNFVGRDALDPIVFTFRYKEKGKLTRRSMGFLKEEGVTDEDHKNELLEYPKLPVPFQSAECLTPYGIYFMRGLSAEPALVAFTSPYRLSKEVVDLYSEVVNQVLPDEHKSKLVEALDRGLSRYPLLDLDL